jgi:cell division protein ZapA
MPEVSISIGGRSYAVACQPGEEALLRSAAAVIDTEAQSLLAQVGRMPEPKMLLMAALMVADRLTAQQQELRELRSRIDALELREPARIEVPVEVPVEVLVEVPVEVPVEVRVEVPVLAPAVVDTLTELAGRLESLADTVEARAHGAPVG